MPIRITHTHTHTKTFRFIDKSDRFFDSDVSTDGAATNTSRVTNAPITSI